MLAPGSKVRVPSAQLEWLRDQTARWRAEGLIDDGVRAGILAGYDADSPQRRGMLALVIVGILICTVGLLLLIGYNWALMTPAARVGLILTGVAGAFALSALAYRAGRATAGEALAFAGALIFGNAIWLIAQVLHIQGHFPDGFLWSAIGALACAWLLRSTWTGTAAAALLGAWSVAEGASSPGTNYTFLWLWPVTIWLARRLDSQGMLSVAAVGAVTWVATVQGSWSLGPLWPASIVLAGCAIYAVGSWEGAGSRMQPAWRTTGLLVLLVMFVPLMVVELHQDLLSDVRQAPLVRLAIVAGIALVALSGLVQARSPADWAVSGVAIAATAWTAAAPLGFRSATMAAVLFSVLALMMCVALVRTALTTGRLGQLVFGVLFALTFLMVRWISLLENMLWSGALLLAAGGGLLLIARLWRAREGETAVRAGGVA